VALRGVRAARLLDVGCGTARSREVYAERVEWYIGLDLSLGALVRARQRASTLTRGDATRLPFADASFDVVAFSSVLHHLPDRPAALREARRVLRPGGWVFAFDPNLLHPAMALFRHPSSPLYNPVGVSPDERPLLPVTLREEFRAAGFRAVAQRCQSDIPYRAVAPRLLHAMLSIYNALDWLWERSGAGRFFGTFVITWGRNPEPAR
jgi:ubiquinone/menaquinone biosynthesis C-methylase UbiE